MLYIHIFFQIKLTIEKYYSILRNLFLRIGNFILLYGINFCKNKFRIN